MGMSSTGIQKLRLTLAAILLISRFKSAMQHSADREKNTVDADHRGIRKGNSEIIKSQLPTCSAHVPDRTRGLP